MFLSKKIQALTALFIGTAGIAFAGECPEGKEGKPTLEAPTEAVGEVSNVLGTIELGTEMVALDDHILRIRTVTLPPDGIIPLHSHEDRPAWFYMKNGTLTIHRQDCTVPITLNTGDVSAEGKGTVHWAKNDGKEHAILLVTDIVHVEDQKMDMPM